MAGSETLDELEIVDPSIQVDDIQDAIEDIVEKLQKKQVPQIDEVDPTDYSAEKGAHGEAVVTTILIAFAGALAKEAASSLWKTYIWPSLELRLKGKVKRKSKSA
jgi:hypothetical protein